MARIGAATFALGDSPSTPADEQDAYVRTELAPARFAAHLQDPAVAAYIADVANSPAGYLMLRSDGHAQCVAHAERPLRLWRIYVLPQHHGFGVAAALMKQAFAHARDNGHDVMWLGVSEHNARGQAFYRKCGFQTVGKEQFHVGSDAHHDLVMSCAVTET
jgi:ribosomal protein S18 acetylase RimI-like enzyme